MADEGSLLEFYGAECDHCKMVAGFLDRLWRQHCSRVEQPASGSLRA